MIVGEKSASWPLPPWPCDRSRGLKCLGDDGGHGLIRTGSLRVPTIERHSPEGTDRAFRILAKIACCSTSPDVVLAGSDSVASNAPFMASIRSATLTLRRSLRRSSSILAEASRHRSTYARSSFCSSSTMCCKTVYVFSSQSTTQFSAGHGGQSNCILFHCLQDPRHEFSDRAQVIQPLRQLERDTLTFRHADECSSLPVRPVETYVIELKRSVPSKGRRLDFEQNTENL